MQKSWIFEGACFVGSLAMFGLFTLPDLAFWWVILAFCSGVVAGQHIPKAMKR